MSFVPLKDFNLTGLNTFGIQARCRYYFKATTVEALQEALAWAREQTVPVLVLGGGSNVLFIDDAFDGLVLQPAIMGIEHNQFNNLVMVQAGAGVVWHDLVMHTVRNGWGGLENLSLIWGWTGAAPMQNIGAYGAEAKDSITRVEVLNRDTLKIRWMDAEECRFGYRESIFKRELKDKVIIVRVEFALDMNHQVNISYGAIREILAEMGIKQPTIADVSRAVIRIRQSKLPDPDLTGNAGSFFKNPEIQDGMARELKISHPDMPTYPSPLEGRTKVPAGYLIEKAGWKGHNRGTHGVHPAQALVLVNLGGATGEDIWQLAQDIRASVAKKFGITLQPEVNLVA